MKTIDVLAIGMATIDLISEVDSYPAEGTTGPVRRTLTGIGGQVGRAALACARLGAKTTLTGMIGQGVFADILRAQLAAEALYTQFVIDENAASSQHSCVVLSGEKGERTILWTPQPRVSSTCLDLCATLVPLARCVLLDMTDIPLAASAAKRCREHGIPSVIDTGSYKPNADPLLYLIDYIISPEKFFRARATASGCSYLDAIRDVAERFEPALVVSTEGDVGGTYVEKGGEMRRYDPVPVKSVDSCGAGDVFHGGFAYALARNWPILKALEFSAWLAAEKCTQFGNAGLASAAQIPARFSDAS